MKHRASCFRGLKTVPVLCRLLLSVCAVLTAGAVLTAAAALPAQAAAPEWSTHFGGPGYNVPSQVVTDSAGNVIVVGTSTSASTQEDFRVLKYDPSGSLLWTRRYNGTGNSFDYGVAVDVDSADNIYVSGSSQNSASGYDIITLKYSPDGTQLWRQRYGGGSSPVALKVSRAGDVYVAISGYTLKYDTNGNKIWGRRFDTDYNQLPATHFVTGLALDQDGNAYITGAAQFREPGYGYTSVAETTKYLSDGTRAWTRRYADPRNGSVSSNGIAVAPDGNIVVGDTVVRGYSEYNAGNFLIFKYGPDGHQLWQSEPQFSGNDSTLQALAVDSTGNIIAAGYSGYNNGGSGPTYYYAVAQLTSSGTQVWAKTSSTIYNYKVYLALDASGNAFLTGTSASDTSLSDFLTVTEKYAASDGSLLWKDSQSVAGDTEARGVTVDSSGAAIVIATDVDYNINYNGDYDFATFKYLP